MLQITVQNKTYLLATDTGMDGTKQAVLDAVRAAPAFLSLRTVLGGHVEVMVTATSPVVLEQHDDEHLSALPLESVADRDYDDLYGMDYT